MAKPEWGSKHVCRSCESKFYDMNRVPAICPACGTKEKKSNRVNNQDAIPTKLKEPIPATTIDEGSEIEDGDGTQILGDSDNIEENEDGIANLLEGGVAQED